MGRTIVEEPLTEQQKRYVESIDSMHEYPPAKTAIAVDTPDIYLKHTVLQKADIFLLGKPQDWKHEHRSNVELLKLLKENQMEKLFVPRASTFNGIISDPNDFKDEFHTHGMKIMTGCNTDGLEIPSGSAALIYTADCPTIIYHEIENDILIVAHAGLASVVDIPYITTGEPSRSHEGVVDEIMLQTRSTEDYEIFVLCGISHESFIYDPHHPIYGEKNQKILQYLIKEYGQDSVPLGFEHGGISISGIIKQQFLDYGLNAEKIHSDKINTYTNCYFWSHSRYSHQGIPNCGRNGVLVLHKK
ncbi:laccase domain-containing protein [Candidatus Nomurabacteria bacterium]|nr:laccase domain-containing protein [Candidatus Nomurabacteria bacterium]